MQVAVMWQPVLCKQFLRCWAEVGELALGYVKRLFTIKITKIICRMGICLTTQSLNLETIPRNEQREN